MLFSIFYFLSFEISCPADAIKSLQQPSSSLSLPRLPEHGGHFQAESDTSQEACYPEATLWRKTIKLRLKDKRSLSETGRRAAVRRSFPLDIATPLML